MTKHNETINGEISTLLADIIPVYEATPPFMQNQRQANILSDNLCSAKIDLINNKFENAKKRVANALSAYKSLANSGINFTDDCDTDVDILKNVLK